MQEVYFPVLFPEYIPPEGLEEALAQLLVTAAEVDQAARSIRLTGTSGVYIAQRRLREVEDAPVSYTHLDVYKRQPLSQGRLSAAAGLRADEYPQAVSYTHLDVYKRQHRGRYGLPASPHGR